MSEGMKTVTSIDVLCKRVGKMTATETKLVIGLDGMDGVGKTTVGKELVRRLHARLISLDDYLEKKRGTYVPHLRCDEVRELVENSDSSIVIDGVCLRAVAERCGIDIGLYVYVRRINQHGRCDDEEICLACEPPEVLKERERELRAMAESFLDKDSEQLTASDRHEYGLKEELIDYHHNYSPVKKADIIFDAVESGMQDDAD
jgi:hypothetical protein